MTNGTPLSPPMKFTCPLCDAVHIPSRCKSKSKYGVCGCCWAIECFGTKPLNN